MAKIWDAVRRQTSTVLGAFALATLASLVAQLVAGRRLHRQTMGMGADTLRKVYLVYDAVFDSLSEGLVISSPANDRVLLNQQAAVFLVMGTPTVPDASSGTKMHAVSFAELPSTFEHIIGSQRIAHDELHLHAGRLLLVNQWTTSWTTGGGDTGHRVTVTTFTDQTAIQSLDSELRRVTTLTQALEAQTHEYANRLHTIVSLLELEEFGEAQTFANACVDDHQRELDRLLLLEDHPALTALLLGKHAEAREQGVELHVQIAAPGVLRDIDQLALLTIMGNLVDNAIHAAKHHGDLSAPSTDSPSPAVKRVVAVTLKRTSAGPVLEVFDNGEGFAADQPVDFLTPGVTTKAAGETGGGYGLALVQQAAHRTGATLGVALLKYVSARCPATVRRSRVLGRSDHDDSGGDCRR